MYILLLYYKEHFQVMFYLYIFFSTYHHRCKSQNDSKPIPKSIYLKYNLQILNEYPQSLLKYYPKFSASSSL